MHCIHCGALLPEGAKFCTSCGRPVQAAPEAPVQEPIAEESGDASVVTEEPVQEASEAYEPPINASEGYKAANAQLPPSYSNPNYSSQEKSSYSGTAATPSNGLAIAGFVCSLILIPLGLGAIAAVAGLILSIMGLNSAKTLPENKGRGLALAGIIISAIRIAIILILIVAMFALMLRGAGHVGHEIISNWSEYAPYNF